MIKTGKAPLSVMTFAAILSISLVVNLPGLAVTPMLGTLSKVFPDTTQLEKQMLTVLPNLVIIPFVFLSGKLSLNRHKVAVIVTALAIFTACAVAYMFANTITELIVVSCLLGCGAGLIIPFSKGLISDTFAGRYRMNKMGIVSGISNTSLVAATFAVGWLSHGNWHLPFLVYMVAVIPLALSIKLRDIPRYELIPQATATTPAAASDKTVPAAVSEIPQARTWHGLYPGRIFALMGVYAFITFTTIVVSYYCPFLIEKHNWSSELTGTITALFYLFILIPGFTLKYIVRVFKGGAFIYAALIMTVGLALFAFLPLSWSMCIGACMAGFGYGVCQPLIYDKASRSVNNGSRSTLALAIVLSANYGAVVVTPFIIDGLRHLFHAGSQGTFAFMACFVMLIGFTLLTVVLRKSFAFSVNNEYYTKNKS